MTKSKIIIMAGLLAASAQAGNSSDMYVDKLYSGMNKNISVLETGIGVMKMSKELYPKISYEVFEFCVEKAKEHLEKSVAPVLEQARKMDVWDVDEHVEDIMDMQGTWIKRCTGVMDLEKIHIE